MGKNKLAKIKISGYNLNNLLNTCIKSNIELNNVYRTSPQEMEITLSDGNLKVFRQLDLSKYDIEILTPTIKQRIKHFVIYRIGLIVGIIASIILFFFMQNRLININIYGLNNIQREDIVEKINEYGIYKFSLMNFDCENVEKYLMDNFNFSFVSVIKKGNTLIINTKEGLPDVSDKYLPITSDYNMVIRNINVYSGTSNYKNGDIVFAGDIIVEPYEIINNEKIDITPCAEIEGEIYFCASYDFKFEEEICIRSGESQVISVEYYLGKYKLFGNNYDCKYDNFEIEVEEKMITSYFLPISIKKVIAYEKINKQITNTFDIDKITEQLKNEAYAKVPNGLQVESEDVKINSTNYGNIVTIYLKSSVYLKYESK